MERSDVIGGSRQYGQRDIPYALTRGELRKRKESIRSISLTADVTTITTSANVTWIFGSDQFDGYGWSDKITWFFVRPRSLYRRGGS